MLNIVLRNNEFRRCYPLSIPWTMQASRRTTSFGITSDHTTWWQEKRTIIFNRAIDLFGFTSFSLPVLLHSGTTNMITFVDFWMSNRIWKGLTNWNCSHKVTSQIIEFCTSQCHFLSEEKSSPTMMKGSCEVCHQKGLCFSWLFKRWRAILSKDKVDSIFFSWIPSTMVDDFGSPTPSLLSP